MSQEASASEPSVPRREETGDAPGVPPRPPRSGEGAPDPVPGGVAEVRPAAESALPDAFPGSAPGEVTLLLHRMQTGDGEAREELYGRIYETLHDMARLRMRSQRPEHTLQPTALVNEAYLRLARLTDTEWKGRAHFLSVAACAMRSILVDHGRRAATEKRCPQGEVLGLDAVMQAVTPESLDFLSWNDCIEKLAARDPRTAQVVEMRLFTDLSFEEIASLLDTSVRSVERIWRYGKTWLRREIERG